MWKMLERVGDLRRHWDGEGGVSVGETAFQLEHQEAWHGSERHPGGVRGAEGKAEGELLAKVPAISWCTARRSKATPL